VSIAAHGATSSVSAAASNKPGLILGQLGGSIIHSHSASDTQMITRVLSRLIADSSAKIQQRDVKQPHFSSTS